MPAASPNVKALLAANWKMNPVDGGEAVDLVKGILGMASEAVDNVEVALFPPTPLPVTVIKMAALSLPKSLLAAHFAENVPVTSGTPLIRMPSKSKVSPLGSPENFKVKGPLPAMSRR